jgi:DNA (cytosine-5)-methyltransferase 1
MLKMLDLFSGIGGFSLAASWTGGIETVAFCEIEPYCQKVLHKHWPDVPIYPDIKQLRGEDIGSVDIVCGGFPCQPFSCAGKQRGKEDDRYLWPEMFRVIQETKPTWVIGENVAGLIELGLEDCFFNLEAEGYEVQALIIPACAVNAPHRRDRIWIVGYSKGNHAQQSKECDAGRKGTVPQENRIGFRSEFSRPSSLMANADREHGKRWPEPQQPNSASGAARFKSYRGSADVSNSQCRGLQSGIQQRTWSEAKFFAEDGRNTRRNYTRGMWDAEPGMGRLAYGIPRAVVRDKLKALGNSIVPQVAYQILQGIVEIERQLREG